MDAAVASLSQLALGLCLLGCVVVLLLAVYALGFLLPVPGRLALFLAGLVLGGMAALPFTKFLARKDEDPLELPHVERWRGRLVTGVYFAAAVALLVAGVSALRPLRPLPDDVAMVVLAAALGAAGTLWLGGLLLLAQRQAAAHRPRPSSPGRPVPRRRFRRRRTDPLPGAPSPEPPPPEPPRSDLPELPPPATAVEMEVLRVEAAEPPGRSPVLTLQERRGRRRLLPIFCGLPEAQAIAMGIERVQTPMPMTHDLMQAMLDELGVDLARVVITGLVEGSFRAEILLRSTERLHRLECRPSDGIALAVRTGAPVFAEAAVLDEAGREAESGGEPAGGAAPPAG